MFVNTNKPLQVSVLFIRPSSGGHMPCLCRYYTAFHWFAFVDYLHVWLHVYIIYLCVCVCVCLVLLSMEDLFVSSHVISARQSLLLCHLTKQFATVASLTAQHVACDCNNFHELLHLLQSLEFVPSIT